MNNAVRIIDVTSVGQTRNEVEVERTLKLAVQWSYTLDSFIYSQPRLLDRPTEEE